MAKYVYLFSEGNASMRDLLGGKGVQRIWDRNNKDRNNKKIINSKRYILTPYHVKVVGCFFKYIFFMNIKSLRSVW